MKTVEFWLWTLLIGIVCYFLIKLIRESCNTNSDEDIIYPILIPEVPQ